MIRVLLVDDHEIVLEGLKRVLDSAGDIVVLADASTADEAVAAVQRLTFDLAIVDLSLGTHGSGSGIDLLHKLAQIAPMMRCVVLSMHDDPTLIHRARKAGAKGYFSKGKPANTLIDGLRRVMKGEFAFDHESGAPPKPITLTKRERQTLEGMLGNKSPKTIATSLGISDKTLYRHRSNLMLKLGARASTDVLRLARDFGLLTDLF